MPGGDEVVRAMIAGLRERDEKALKLFINCFGFNIQGKAILTGKGLVTKEDAEDIAQRVILRVYIGAARFEGSVREFQGWIRTIAYNATCDWLRSRGRTLKHGETVELEHADSAQSRSQAPDPLDDLLLGELRTQLEIIIDKLPPRQRDAARAHFLLELTDLEAAKFLGTDAATFRGNLHCARKKIRPRLKYYYENQLRGGAGGLQAPVSPPSIDSQVG